MAETRTIAMMRETAQKEIEEATLVMDGRMTALEGRIDEKMEKLDEKMVGLDGKLGKLDDRIAEIFEAVRLMTNPPPTTSRNNTQEVRNQNQDGTRFRAGAINNGYSGLTRLSRIDFPRFNGDKVRDWLFKIEQFFLIDHTPKELKCSHSCLGFLLLHWNPAN